MNPAFSYLSTTKFVDAIKQLAKENKLPRKLERNESVAVVHVWYKGIDAYQGKFDTINIKKPVYFKVHTSRNRDIFITHEQILKLFDIKPVICIKQNFYRFVPQGQDRLNYYIAVFDFEPHETSEGFTYYKVDIVKETSTSRIKTIERQIVNSTLKPIKESDDESSGTV